ncbi:hypothetical protein [Campylobacter sp.]|uniref:hypothetical protein n=1 Tax=Campylobacter sp. TaxID=205 RepID=UPI002A638343|nr:hypothetical protein [Campylobacter sp.]MDD7704551.1 hypothetical protein [Campylobacteraceae bacterium]MDY2636027.1 hypothetical protein [Campylobacter sp.]
MRDNFLLFWRRARGASAIAAAKILRQIFKPNIGAEKRCKSFADRLGYSSQKG